VAAKPISRHQVFGLFGDRNNFVRKVHDNERQWRTALTSKRSVIMGAQQKRDFQFSFADTQRTIRKTKKLIYDSEENEEITARQREIYIGLISCLQGIQQELYSVKVGMNWIN
jgi:hypothetical protein